MNTMQKEVASKAFRIVENEYFKLRDEVKAMEDSLNSIRRLGINDYESQAEMLNQQLAMELAKNNTAGIRAIEQRLALLAQYGGVYVSLRDMLEHERKQLSQIKAKYEEAKVDATQNLPHKFVVTNAYEAEKKAYPIRWLITLIATISTLLLSFVVLIAIDRFSDEELKKIHLPTHLSIREWIGRTANAITPSKQQKWEIMDNYFSNTSFVNLMLKWRKHLAVITLIGALAGIIFRVPPSSPHSISRKLLPIRPISTAIQMKVKPNRCFRFCNRKISLTR